MKIEIECPYNIGQELYYINDNEIRMATLVQIQVSYSVRSRYYQEHGESFHYIFTIRYPNGNTGEFREKEFYAKHFYSDKKELIKHLVEQL